MNEINEEIKQTLNLMQTDIDYEAHSELQCHLACLLEIKRNELQHRLVERSWFEPADCVGRVVSFDPATYKSVKLDGQIADEAKPLTADELKAGGWWCGDTSEDALKAFILYGLETDDDTPWDGSFYGCFLYVNGRNLLDRGLKHHTDGLKQIHRIGNEFYWGDDEN